MRALSPFPLLLVSALLAGPATAGTREGAVHSYRVVPATAQGPARSVRVYLPPSYDRPQARDRHYPVLILMHGWPGGDGNWPGEGHCADTLDSLSATGEIPETIAVIPNGNGVGTFGRSFWLNSADGTSRIEDFVARDLVAWSDSTFRTVPDAGHRTLVGLSDGGTAAFNLLMRHRDRFSGAGSLSGRFRLKKEFGMSQALVGSGDAATAFLEANSPAARVEHEAVRLAGTRLYLDCGLDDADLEDNRQFHNQLVRLGVPHEYHEYPGGHGWGYWRAHLRDALISLARSGPGKTTSTP